MATVDGPTGVPVLPRRERYGTVGGSVAVFAFVFVFLGFWVIWDAAVPGEQEIAPGSVVRVSPRVSYVPTDGWRLDKAATTPGSVSKVTAGGSVLVVQGGEWHDDLSSAVRRERDLLEKAGKMTFASGVQTFHTDNGLTGSRLSFYNSAAEGVLWVALDPASKTLVKVTAESPAGQLQGALGSMREMVDSVKIGDAA